MILMAPPPCIIDGRMHYLGQWVGGGPALDTPGPLNGIERSECHLSASAICFQHRNHIHQRQNGKKIGFLSRKILIARLFFYKNEVHLNNNVLVSAILGFNSHIQDKIIIILPYTISRPDQIQKMLISI